MEILQKQKFSVLTDESTDISTSKTSCVVVRFYNASSKRIESQFFELMSIFDSRNQKNPSGATGEVLFQYLMSCFEEEQIPLENIIGFGFASDGCNVMMGANNSVASRLRENLPGIVIMKCICHSLHLCSSEACEKLPRSCEDLARNIYNYFNSSAKRQCEFAEFQKFFEVKVHKLLHPSQTRWLSLRAVVSRLLEQWDLIIPTIDRYDFENDLLPKLSLLTPTKALSIKERYYTPSLFPLMQLLPRVVNMEDSETVQKIDDQWR